jgi:anti-sigma factor RsiW
MNCADLEALLCDYVDGTLHGDAKSRVEEHLAACRSCAEFVRDAAGAVAFMERTPAVEPPAELLTRILFEIPQARAEHKARSLWGRLKMKWVDPALQPRFAMGMAMTVLSFAMLGHFAGIEMRQIKAADLNPVAIWVAVEDRALRVWERGMKYYENLRLVYEIQTRLKDWGDQAAVERSSKADEKKGGGGQAIDAIPGPARQGKE